jgi:hypothetical protein
LRKKKKEELGLVGRGWARSGREVGGVVVWGSGLGGVVVGVGGGGGRVAVMGF